LESGEGGQRPDEVKHGADSLVVRKIFLGKSQSVPSVILTKKVTPLPLAPALKGGGKKNCSTFHQNLRFAPFREGANNTEIFCTTFSLPRRSICLNSLNF